MSYPIDTCEEPLYTLLYNCGLTEVSAEDYNVLAAADPATMQQYLESCAADPESYPWDSVIYTLRGDDGAAGGGEDGGAEVAGGGEEGGETAAEDAGPPVPIDTCEEPMYTLLYNCGLTEISTADYNVLASADPATMQSYLESCAADPESYPWESIIYTLKGEGAGGEGGEEGAEGGLEGGEYGYGEGEDGEYYYEYEEEVRELAPLPVIEEEKPPEGSWPCQKCTYLNKIKEATECGVCLVRRDAEQVGYKGKFEKTPEGRHQLVISSSDVPNCRHLRGAFKVIKTNSEATFGGKKERVYEIDFFTRSFKNCDLNGKVTVSLQSANLYRVERSVSDPRALKLLFFKHPNPIDLIFSSSTSRQRFVELAALQRRNPVVWGPSFCRQGCKELTVKVEAKTVEFQGKDVTVAGNQQFMVSRMPYEVQHLWVGTMHLLGRGLPQNGPRLKEFMPLVNDMYFIGLQEVPSDLLKNSKAITDFFTAYFGTNFYVLLNTASDTNIFAGLEGRKQLHSPCVLVIVVRRAGLAKIGNVDYVELLEDGKKHESHGVFVSLRLQESSIGVMVQTIKDTVTDTLVRNAKIQNFLQKIKCGDVGQDISVRFDYFFLMGQLGYPTLPTDELHQQIGGQVILSDFQECTILQEQCLPDRVLFWHRPRSAKASILKYSSCPGLGGIPNLQGQFDLFVQRPYCYALSPPVPDCKVELKSILFNCDTLTEVRDPECRIMSDAFEGLPVTLPLKNASGRYSNDKVPPLLPVTPAYEYLRAQSISFSLFGMAPGVKKKELIATAVIPLRDMLIPDEPKAHQAFVLRHSTVIGFLETTLVWKRLLN